MFGKNQTFIYITDDVWLITDDTCLMIPTSSAHQDFCCGVSTFKRCVWPFVVSLQQRKYCVRESEILQLFFFGLGLVWHQKQVKATEIYTFLLVKCGFLLCSLRLAPSYRDNMAELIQNSFQLWTVKKRSNIDVNPAPRIIHVHLTKLSTSCERYTTFGNSINTSNILWTVGTMWTATCCMAFILSTTK